MGWNFWLCAELLGAAVSAVNRTAEMKTSESTAVDVQPTPAPPPVVQTGKKISLADHLDLRNLPLATTPGGTNFCLKALHPSEHTIKSARVPGGNLLSVAVCSDAVYTFPVNDPNATFLITQSPDIMAPCSVRIEDNSGNPPDDWVFYNAAFGGIVQHEPTIQRNTDFLRPLSRLVSKYRITSQSVTAELIAPALSDQGTITACQRVISPKTVSWVDSGTSSTIDDSTMRVFNDIDIYEMPTFNTSAFILGTSAYTAKAREGCYQPLKLTTFEWQNFQDPSVPVNLAESDEFPYRGYNEFGVGTQGTVMIPHFENRPSTLTSWTQICPTPKPCGHNFGFIQLTGMAKDVAVRIRVRQVVELIAPPATTYAPLMEVSLPPDSTSIKMYFEISSRMADGYPASYNDLGKLKDIILGIGRGVLKYADPVLSTLSAVPGPVGAVASGAKLATGIGKALLGEKKKKQMGGKAG